MSHVDTLNLILANTTPTMVADGNYLFEFEGTRGLIEVTARKLSPDSFEIVYSELIDE